MRSQPVTGACFTAMLLLSFAACGGGESADTTGETDPGAGTLVDTAATPSGGMTGDMPASADTVPTGTTATDTMGGAGGR